MGARRLGRALAAAGAIASTTLAATGVLQPAPAAALLIGTYYVSPSGSDSAAGTQQAPWRTIAHATATAPAGATVQVAGGTYAPFAVTKPGQTVTGAPGQQVRVVGAPGVRDVVRLGAAATTVKDLTVTGCVPSDAPVGGYDQGGSAAVRLDAAATGAAVTGLTITDSRGTTSQGLPFGCYGVFVVGADGVRISGNDISGTGTGVYLNGGGRASLVAQNTIHDNDVLIRNTPGGDDDYGANGITFANVDALPAAVASGNTITGNSGPSADYGYDGGAFEIYNSSHVQMLDNTIANNENVLETGTSPDGTNPLGECIGNSFVGNTAQGRTPGSDLERSVGMILRCATVMTIAGNSFDDIDHYVFNIFADDKFSSDVRGMVLDANTVTDQFQKVYNLGLDPLASALVIQSNRFGFTGPVFASYDDDSTSPSLQAWQQRTGLDLLSSQG